MSMTEKFLQMRRSALQTYTGEETLTHDDDNEIEENKNEETLT